ncbi:hypothetical protein LX32DRAFT_637351 [Colletotrichum zoysiae]|uniref:Uncharacterized protein n=1 Tax=Colletotrichum zoysiae TaxID=1216348 RepID=A0AAD9M374_9PEZI|nr:hypothetical protein LX32DRAFT_637351 [Colletotrichum zoysiae]
MSKVQTFCDTNASWHGLGPPSATYLPTHCPAVKRRLRTIAISPFIWACMGPFLAVRPSPRRSQSLMSPPENPA